MADEVLKEYIDLIVEKKIREADVTDGKAPWGSKQHIKDLEKRLADALLWRNKHRKGTEARANYARLATRLRSELKSAQRAAQKKVVKK